VGCNEELDGTPGFLKEAGDKTTKTLSQTLRRGGGGGGGGGRDVGWGGGGGDRFN